MRHSQDSQPTWQAKVQEAKWLNDKSPRWDIIISTYYYCEQSRDCSQKGNLRKRKTFIPLFFFLLNPHTFSIPFRGREGVLREIDWEWGRRRDKKRGREGWKNDPRSERSNYPDLYSSGKGGPKFITSYFFFLKSSHYFCFLFSYIDFSYFIYFKRR